RRALTIGGNPLDRARRTLCLYPVEGKQVVEVLRRPRNRIHRPGALESAGHRVACLATSALVFPAQSLLLGAGRRGLGAHTLGWIMGAMRLAERVSAGDERNGLLVVHGHATEGLTDVLRSRERIRIAVGTRGIDVNQAHLHSGEWMLQLSLARVTLVTEKLLLRSPIHQVGLPII